MRSSPTCSLGAVFLTALLLSLASPAAQAANLLTNGDFESGSLYSNRGNEIGSLPGWSLTARYTSLDAPPQSGAQALNLNDGMHDNNGGLARIQQSVSTIIGESYFLSGWISANTGGSANEAAFLWDNAPVLDYQNLNTAGYEEFRTTVVATSTLSTFAFAYGNDGTGLFVDNLSVEAVPEPSRSVLAALGLAGIVLRRRRRQAALTV